MPRHSFHKLVALCGSRAVHSFRSIKASHVSSRLLRLDLWEDRGWYCGGGGGGGGPPSEDTFGSKSRNSNVLVVSVAGDNDLQNAAVQRRRAKPVVTVVLCGSTEAAISLQEMAFRKCLHRVRSTLMSGKVLPGAGYFELHAAEALRQQAEADSRTPSRNGQGGTDEDALLRGLACGGFAAALEQVVRRTAQNLGATDAEVCERLDAAAASARQSHKDRSLTAWATGSPLLHSDAVDAGSGAVDGECDMVLDDWEAKRGALSRAAQFMRVCMLTDVRSFS